MQGRRGNGIMIGVVTDLRDPDNLGRVKVRFPTLQDCDSFWARLVSPMAGARRGMFMRPEVEDEVLVAFEHGDPRQPFILGAMWSTVDRPPPDDGDAKKNNWRFIQSRSGHIIKLDDTEGAEKIELIDKDGQRKIVIDSANQKIQVLCDMGDVEIKAPQGKVTIEAMNVEIKATQALTLQAGTSISVSAPQIKLN